MGNATSRNGSSESEVTIDRMQVETTSTDMWALPEIAAAARLTVGDRLEDTCRRIQDLGGPRIAPSTLGRWESRAMRPRPRHERFWRLAVEQMVGELAQVKR